MLFNNIIYNNNNNIHGRDFESHHQISYLNKKTGRAGQSGSTVNQWHYRFMSIPVAGEHFLFKILRFRLRL